MQHTETFSKAKIENFIKNFDIFVQNIDYRYTLESPLRCGSKEYPQSMFWIKNKIKYIYIPLHIPFIYIKYGARGYTWHGHVLLPMLCELHALDVNENNVGTCI